MPTLNMPNFVALFRGPAPVTAGAAGPLTVVPFSSAVVSNAGRPVSFAPEWTANLEYSHRFDLGRSGALIAAINTPIQSSFCVVAEYLADERPKAMTVTIAELSWRSVDGQIGLPGFLKNIENSGVLTSSFVYPFTGAVRQAFALATTYRARLPIKS